MALPLEGIKILELAQSLGSPYCTSMMADFGAEVINVEPRWGSRTRSMGLTYLKGECSTYFSLNRNKRAICLDWSKPEGKEIVLKLVKNVDIITENFRVGVMERQGLGYDTLAKINPRLIYLNITGFGTKGPWAPRPGVELIFQGYCGMMSLQGPDVRGIPRTVSGAATDMNAGLFAFMGIMLALYERERSGLGQKVETSNTLAALSPLSNAMQAFIFGRKSGESQSIVPFGGYRTKDGFVTVALPSDQYWPNFCKALGIEHLQNEPMFATNIARSQNADAVESLIQSILEQKTTAEWLNLFDKADSLGGPINTPEQVLEDPQILANDMIVTVDHPVTGKTRMIGIPIKLSRTPGKVKSAPPVLDQHTDEILKDFGYTDEQIAELKKKEIVGKMEKVGRVGVRPTARSSTSQKPNE
ncbi:MAG: CoA transferase [Chloroflexota bacterium]